MARSFHSEHWHRVAHLKPQLRAHVPVTRHRSRGQSWYVIQDSATGRFHRFTPTAYRVIGSMDGLRTVDEIWRAAIENLKDEAPSQSDMVDLLSQLHAADLIRSDSNADAIELFSRHRSQSRKRLTSRFANPMALRFPLLNPDRFLTALAPWARPFFGLFGLLLWCVAVVFAGVLAGLHWPELTGNIADHAMGLDNILIMAALFPVLKLLHELGHGLACKLRGGEVRELGVMLLVLAPVPYVDATSSTAFRSRWDRMLVAAAGMLVETFLAALAMFVWTTVEPGLVRTLAFNTMLIAGISTVVFNINPLMRLDGYYMLVDLLDMPNLAQRATRWWASLAERRLFGVTEDPPVTAPGERGWLLAYAPASLLYRTVVMLGIALFVAGTFFIVGIIMAIVTVFTTLVWPLIKIARHVLVAPKLANHRGRAVAVTFGGAGAIVGAVMLAPLPLVTLTEGIIWLPESAILRVREDGFVARIATPGGTMVRAGDLIMVGEESGLVHEAAVTASQIEALTLRLDAELVSDRVQSQVTRAELRLKAETLARQDMRIARLSLESQEAGRLVLPHEADLPGRFLKRGDVVGFLLPPQSRTIRVAVPQADIDLVRTRLKGVDVMLAGLTDRSYSAELGREVPAASGQLPSRALSIDGGGRIAVDARDPKNPRALEGQFLFDVILPPEAGASAFGARAHVRFDHGFEPLGQQVWRRLRQLFLSRLEA